ncbi:xanthine dehydrogenase family protein molybdopterin-binding subunit [Ramlibacter sp. AW1]|uniref:Xanthine dehydrogenase family protein molybdopterin-binding subunit n=1 Tax=Ramlibacter aurantiacus TaxID=2801330 RepID=A0A937D2T2_9BURK|nr:molybdopterin cofactor-binding domain-containing protein [Ramlibacter aurantiacus]MBL0421939.1 xanthine dehydrogenase family protein molybdopterin-binding subunit [Ramlibacter aurantiacus]
MTATAPLPLPAALALQPHLSAWLRFADGRVQVRTGKVEIGQGIVTALAQVAADALGVSLERVAMVPASTESPDEGITSGSRSVHESAAVLRRVGAHARARLLHAAGRQLDIEPGALAVVDGAVLHGGTTTGIDYWSLGPGWLDGDLRAGDTAPAGPPPRSVVGRSVPRLDLPAKVMGRPAFVHDLVLPGMLFGRVVRSPQGHEALASIDLAGTAGLPGVVAVVRDGDFVGVIARREEQAVRARQHALDSARWSRRERFTSDAAVHEWLQAQPTVDGVVLQQVDEAARARAVQRHRARYTRPYIAHAALGPSCAVARIIEGRVEVWTHSQSIHLLREDLSRVLRLPRERITVHHAQGAGCYGHNGADDAALDAVLLSKAVDGQPVKLQWMREDEFAWEPYGPAMVVELQAGLDAARRIVDWSLDAWSNGHLSRPAVSKGSAEPASALLAAWQLDHPMPRAPQVDPPMVNGIEHGGIGRNAATAIYALPNQRVLTHRVDALPLRASSLRSIGAYANIFAIESFMDELAELAGVDPLAFRMQHLRDERARAVLERAAAAGGWRPGRPSDGTTGWGLACAQYCNHLGHFAVVVRLGVDPDLRVQRVVAAVDVGQVINPDGLRNQVEGGIVQAISWTLKEQVRFDAQGIHTQGWADYPILGFAEIPEIEVHLIDRPDDEPLGAGEITMGPVAAAIGNAVHHALGLRVRDLPITRERILELA